MFHPRLRYRIQWLPSSQVYGELDFSILFSNVTVERGAVVRDSIVMPGTVIKEGAVYSMQ